MPVGPVARAQAAAAQDGRELEFILRSILELRLQVEELRRRFDQEGGRRKGEGEFLGEVWTDQIGPGRVAALAPRDAPPPPNTVVVEPGTTMADIEKKVIAAALKETRGNRRRAAEMLGIGERTLYRKIKEYEVPEYSA